MSSTRHRFSAGVRTIWLALLLATGITFLSGGAALMAAGGSIYYCVAGFAIAFTAISLWLRSRWGLWSYAAVIIGTTAWSLWENGLNAWAMLPRLDVLLVLGVGLLLPAIHNGLSKGPTVSRRLGRAAIVITVCIPFAAFVLTLMIGRFGDRDQLPETATDPMTIIGGLAKSSGGTDKNWQEFSGTSAGTRYSNLSYINSKNVEDLRVAWTYSFGEQAPNGLEVTPLKIGQMLYACNSTNVIVALDPDSGREIWRFDPNVDLTNVPFAICRGVAYYKIPDASGNCVERIFTNTVDARLIAVDAITGQRCKGFGTNGEISLLEGMGNVIKGYYFPSSAPTIARGHIIVGGLVFDNQFWGEPSGVIRAFDAITGQLSWAYDVGRPDISGLPPPGETYTLSTPNAWAPMTYDDTLGLVYVPTGAPTPDHYGPQRRPFDDEISTAVLALEVESGHRRWVFQTVHHDLWDYDVASAPVLVDFDSAHGVVRGVLVPTKRGETFLLDRDTGRPIDKVIERKVSQAGAEPNERLSPTQPYPTGIPSLAGGPLTEQMMWGLTPFDQLWCRVKFRQARYEGSMTPPGLTPSIMYPGDLGGMDWGGVSVDENRGILVAVSSYVANYLKLLPRKEADELGVHAFGSKQGNGSLKSVMDIAVQENLPFAAYKAPFLSPLDVPCQQPPWSRLTAIDLKSRRVLWSEPLGSGKDNGPFGIRSHLPLVIGAPAIGGTLLTNGNLTFVGASTDATFRAFETTTGRLLWQSPLPASGNAGAMTYFSPGGNQMIVIAAGGHKLLHGKNGDDLVAFALPR
jgi:quinoprotein glucose dehydrogenase